MPTDDDKNLYQMDLGEPSPTLMQWAKEHIHENPEMRCQIISDFRDLIYARGDCTPHRTDDAFLLRFLRCRHFHLESAYKLFVNYYNFKEDNPQLFEDVNLRSLLPLGAGGLISVPPFKEGTGRRMMLYRLGQWDPDEFTMDQILQGTLAVLEMSLLEQSAQILGGICIFDFKDVSMRQAWHMTPNVARTLIHIMATSFPLQIHALHILNQSYVFDVAYNMSKAFLSDKMKSRIFFHGDDMESFHKYIEPKYLPERYGGIHPDYDYANWIDYVLKTEKIVDELKSLGYKDNELEEVA